MTLRVPRMLFLTLSKAGVPSWARAYRPPHGIPPWADAVQTLWKAASGPRISPKPKRCEHRGSSPSVPGQFHKEGSRPAHTERASQAGSGKSAWQSSDPIDPPATCDENPRVFKIGRRFDPPLDGPPASRGGHCRPRP